MSDCHYLEPKGKSREALVRHLPLGIAWDAFRLPGRTAYKWIGALAEGYERAWEALCAVTKELNPYTTRQMIGEWEESVSLPDKCLPKASTLQERRDWVVWRLTKRRWTTVAEWKELAALFGVEILVVPGWLVQKPALYPFEYPKRYDLFPKLGRFRVYINIKGFEQQGYDYGIRGDGYPVPYGLLPSADDSGFMCIIERVKPANVVIIWNGLTSAMYPAEKLLFSLPEDLPEAEADGIIEEDMAVGPESVITEQSIVVRLAFGKPKSATEAEMLDGANVAAIQDLVTGKWEVIQFRDVEKLTGARYRLTGLIRAQIGTDGAMRAQHVAESRFVLFGQTSQSHEDDIRAGLDIANVPFSPVHVEADRQQPDGFTKALLHFDGSDGSTTFTDETGREWTASGDAQIDTAVSKFGGASGLFDGSGDYISTPDHDDFDFNDDFTIEAWFKCNAATGSAIAIAGHGNLSPSDPSTTTFIARRESSGEMSFRLSTGTSYGGVSLTGSQVFSDTSNTGWHHYAVTRKGDLIRLFIDGTLVDSDTFSDTVPDISEDLLVGQAPASSPWNGWIDEFRLSVGVARWTEDFTPPVAPYAKDVDLTWVRRTRAHYIAVDNFDEEDAPLGEAEEAYEVEIMDGAVPVRTLSVSSETATYTAADQTDDFGAPVSSLTVRVRQIGDNGPGTYREASFTF